MPRPLTVPGAHCDPWGPAVPPPFLPPGLGFLGSCPKRAWKRDRKVLLPGEWGYGFLGRPC